MEQYKRYASPPSTALKNITGGRLKGKTDINPQWRIEALTEMFGLCGIGWYYEEVSRELQANGQEQSLFVTINLYVKVSNEWSKPIYGQGGSMFVSKEKDYYYTNDEALKMAATDALSVCCKQIGIASDVYRGTFNTKYSEPKPETKPETKPNTGWKPKTKQEQLRDDFTGKNVGWSTLLPKYNVRKISDLSDADCDKIRKELTNG